ncbi:MAG: DUF5668 domain-containing protein, partial [Anaerolineales bacterium]
MLGHAKGPGGRERRRGITMLGSRRWTAVWGVVLILVGVAFLLQTFNLVPAGVTQWWPILVIAAGVWLLARGFTERR